MAKPAKVGDVVHIAFYDHAENSARGILLFEVFGRLAKITSRECEVVCWGYVEEVDRAVDRNLDHNEHRYSIVRKAVREIRVLK